MKNLLPQMVHCPKCNARVDGFTAVNGSERPGDGSLSVCVYCCSINVFEFAPSGTISLRVMSDDELKELQQDRAAWRMVQMAVNLSRAFLQEKQSKEN